MSAPLKELKPTAICLRELEKLERGLLKQALKPEFLVELPPRKFKLRSRRMFKENLPDKRKSVESPRRPQSKV
jgi:hypothetical protein